MGIKSLVKKIIKPSNKIYCNVYTVNESSLLQGKNIVITGGSSGIGKAIAIRACNAGAKVLILGRNERKLQEVTTIISRNCVYFVCDLSKDINDDIMDNMESLLGGNIDVFINNAGVYVDNKYLNYSMTDFEDVFNTNVKAPFFLSQFYIKHCQKKNINGNLIFTTSNRALMGDFGPYGMSKASINNLIEGLARENIQHGIRVNGVAPGMTASGINSIKNSDDLYTNSTRGKRVLLPEEIAEVVCFLASDISKCITGAIIPCDEGDRLR